MRALYLKELSSFLSSTIGYVFILIYLIACGLFHWIMSSPTNLLQGAEADLIPFFYMSPFLFLILIPAITMKSFAEEKRTGTIELLFTRPISDFGILIAKYLASVTLLLIAIIPTVTYYISMYFLGKPIGIIDGGATLTSYIGLILLGSVFVAIGIFASTITSSQIIAFIVAMSLCWFLFDGLNILGDFGQFGDFDFFIKNLSLSYHYESIQKGVINSNDLVFFVSSTFLFLFIALTVIKTLKR
jgi:ABC-2 type transport system permease protein